MATLSRSLHAGFTVIELIVVVAILAILTALALPRVKELTDSSKRVAAKADLVVIRTALERYQFDYGYYPDRLHELRAKEYVAEEVAFRDPWGKYYFYAVDNNNIGNSTSYAITYAGPSPNKAGQLYRSWGDGRERIPEGKDPKNSRAWTYSNNCPQEFQNKCTNALYSENENLLALPTLRGYWQPSEELSSKDHHPFYVE